MAIDLVGTVLGDVRSLVLHRMIGKTRKVLCREVRVAEGGRFEISLKPASFEDAIRPRERGARPNLLLTGTIEHRTVDVELPLAAVEEGLNRGLRIIDVGTLDFEAAGRSAVRSRDVVAEGLRGDAIDAGVTIEQLQRRLADRDVDIQRLTADRAALDAQVTAKQAELQKTQREVEGVKQTLAATNARAAELDAALAKSGKRIRELEAAAAAAAQAVPLNDVLDSMGKQVAASATKAVGATGAWRLSDVRLSLKVVVNADGSKVRFPAPGEAGESELSIIDVALRPGAAGGAQETSKVSVPDLSGYSGLVAERKVSGLGLAIEVSYQTVVERPGQAQQAGRVVAQRPRAGSLVLPGSTVELFIGKV